MAVVGAPRRVKALLSSFMRSEKSASGTSEDETDEHSGKKKLDHHSEARNKQEFWERVESFSPFTWFAKPLELSPLRCAQYGWENIDVDILRCVSCKMCVDATLATTWDASMYTKTCSKLQGALKTGHSKMCPWPDNPSPDSFLGLPILSSTKWKEEFQRRSVDLVALGENIPFLDEEGIKELVELREEHIQALQRILLTSDSQWAGKTDDEDELSRVASLTALCGWEGRLSEDDDNSHTLFCNACRREVGLWNFHSLKEMEENPSHLRSKDTTSSPDGIRDCETMSFTEEQSTMQDPAQTQQNVSTGTSDSDIEKTESKPTPECSTAENVLGEENMEEDAGSTPEKGDGQESAMDTSECVGDASEQTRGGEKSADTPVSTHEPLNTRPSSAESMPSAKVSEDHGSHDLQYRKRIHSPMLVVDSVDKSEHELEFGELEKLEKLKYRTEREHPFMTPTHPSTSASAIHSVHLTPLVEGSEYGESLCVEVEEESLDDRLRALDTELEFLSQSAGDVTSERDEEGPNRKRARVEDLEKSIFNVLAEHRNWCPWVVAMETPSYGESLPGWKMLLYELIPSAAPSAGQTLLEAPPSEAWKSVRKMLNDCYVAPIRTSDSTDQ